MAGPSGPAFLYNFYPRSPCGERRANLNIRQIQKIISIHALLAESDGFGLARLASRFNFYPRSPCGERQALGLPGWLRVLISIHALLAESDAADISTRREANISIHALLAESDGGMNNHIKTYRNFYPRSPCGERPVMNNIIFVPGKFLSTLSLRRATAADISTRREANISIHALLAESDSAPRITPTASRNFYPRSPCGERRLHPKYPTGYR